MKINWLPLPLVLEIRAEHRVQLLALFFHGLIGIVGVYFSIDLVDLFTLLIIVFLHRRGHLFGKRKILELRLLVK